MQNKNKNKNPQQFQTQQRGENNAIALVSYSSSSHLFSRRTGTAHTYIHTYSTVLYDSQFYSLRVQYSTVPVQRIRSKPSLAPVNNNDPELRASGQEGRGLHPLKSGLSRAASCLRCQRCWRPSPGPATIRVLLPHQHQPTSTPALLWLGLVVVKGGAPFQGESPRSPLLLGIMTSIPPTSVATSVASCFSDKTSSSLRHSVSEIICNIPHWTDMQLDQRKKDPVQNRSDHAFRPMSLARLGVDD